MANGPVLVLVAHGTERAAARSVVGGVTADVRTLLPGVDVRLAHVDVQSPALTAVMADVRAAGRRAVVVPLLLSAGYHVEVDIADAVDAALDVVTPTLAGHSALVDIAVSRLDPVGLDALVVAATGSSRAGARDQVERFAVAVADRTGLPVTVGWAAAGEPSVAAAVRTAVGGAVGSAVGAAAGTASSRVGVVSYLLAPGVFAARVRADALAAGATAVGDPLGPDPRLAAIVVERFRAAGG